MKAWKKKALELHYSAGMSWRKIAKALNIPKSTVSDYLRRATKTDYLDEVQYQGNKPKVLLYDLETSMIQAYTWGLWKQNISIDAIVQDWYILCFSARWLGEEATMSCSLHHFPVKEGCSFKDNEEHLVKTLWHLVDEADALIAYNGKKFDKKKMNAKFLEYGLPEPSPYKIIDPMLIVKGNFALTSNKMDYVAKYVSDVEEGKLKTGLQLWIDCMNGDERAMEEMQTYCDQDIDVLERVYMSVRHWDSNSPNLALHYEDDTPRCNSCGSTELTPIENKYHHTNLSAFSLVRCDHCRKILRDRTNVLSKDKRKSLLMNT